MQLPPSENEYDLWCSFRQILSACLTGGSIPSAKEKLIDWRYFYADQGKGKVTCGVVREAVARYLRSTLSPADFLTHHWYDSLKGAGRNPSVLGFYVETMLLSWISLNGCAAAGHEFSGRPRTFFFNEPKPTMDQESPNSLYIPAAFNYKAVDGILVALDTANDTARITAIRITISERHSDSEARFFTDWKWWRDIVACSKVKFRFLWIIEDVGNKPAIQMVEAEARQIRRQEQIWSPDFERRCVSVKDVSMDIGIKLEAARKARHS